MSSFRNENFKNFYQNLDQNIKKIFAALLQKIIKNWEFKNNRRISNKKSMIH